MAALKPVDWIRATTLKTSVLTASGAAAPNIQLVKADPTRLWLSIFASGWNYQQLVTGYTGSAGGSGNTLLPPSGIHLFNTNGTFIDGQGNNLDLTLALTLSLTTATQIPTDGARLYVGPQGASSLTLADPGLIFVWQRANLPAPFVLYWDRDGPIVTQEFWGSASGIPPTNFNVVELLLLQDPCPEVQHISDPWKSRFDPPASALETLKQSYPTGLADDSGNPIDLATFIEQNYPDYPEHFADLLGENY